MQLFQQHSSDGVYSRYDNLSIVTNNDTNTMHYKKLEHDEENIIFIFEWWIYSMNN